MGEKKTVLSIVTINYNTPQLCAETVQAVLDTMGELPCEIIVVDNSGPDKVPFSAEDAHVTVYAGVENRGFGHACNYGAARAHGELLLFLNSDTVLSPGALQRAVACMDTVPHCGAVGIRTTLEDGGFDHGCKRGFPTPLRSLCYFAKLDRLFPQSRICGGYRYTWMPPEQSGEVDAVSGAFLLMPRALFETLGGFDESFFMYGEDLDLCYRIKQAGYAVYYCGDAHMLHRKGSSGLAAKSEKVIGWFYEAMHLFYNKHYRTRYPAPVGRLVHLAVELKYRLTLAAARRQKRRAAGGVVR